MFGFFLLSFSQLDTSTFSSAIRCGRQTPRIGMRCSAVWWCIAVRRSQRAGTPAGFYKVFAHCCNTKPHPGRSSARALGSPSPAPHSSPPPSTGAPRCSPGRWRQPRSPHSNSLARQSTWAASKHEQGRRHCPGPQLSLKHSSASRSARSSLVTRYLFTVGSTPCLHCY